jgi:hypothetical protein
MRTVIRIRRKLLALAMWSLVAIALDACDAQRRVALSPAPLHVTATWWSPTALRAGIRSLHGRIENTTDSVWSNVQVSIEFTNVRGESLYVTTVPLGSLEPRASLEFATGSLPDQPAGYAIRALSGTSRVERQKVVAR